MSKNRKTKGKPIRRIGYVHIYQKVEFKVDDKTKKKTVTGATISVWHGRKEIATKVKNLDEAIFEAKAYIEKREKEKQRKYKNQR